MRNQMAEKAHRLALINRQSGVLCSRGFAVALRLLKSRVIGINDLNWGQTLENQSCATTV